MAHWQTRELDQTTADAVALMTLYLGATDADDATATELLGELFAGTEGVRHTVAGFQSLCGVLLALLEFETGFAPGTLLQRVGTLVAVPGPVSS